MMSLAMFCCEVVASDGAWRDRDEIASDNAYTRVPGTLEHTEPKLVHASLMLLPCFSHTIRYSPMHLAHVHWTLLIHA